ncbi:MAG: SDR family NAD(P)-dependent oxidoreductase, partial [candidate division KSB1 bacterium]|nr:SDR family NAD(P)-dependent oxidoreductase [candidate division KSB1 bacterium]
MEKLFRLDGKVALVTGASRGLGLAIAQGLAQYGSDVVLVARDKNRLTAASEVVKKTGGRVWPMPFDLQEVEKIPQFFSDVCQVTGGVDILVNCAGTTYRAPAEELTLSQWQEVLNLNLTSVLVLCQ